MRMNTPIRSTRFALTLLAAFAIIPAAYAQTPAPVPEAKVDAVKPTTAADAPFATVNGVAITQKEFHAAFSNHLRQSYYHGKVPEGKLDEVRSEVTRLLIDRLLLLEEAKRRNLPVDEAKIKAAVDDFDKRYATNPLWQENRASLIAELTQQLTDNQLLEQIDRIGHAIPEPTDAEIEAYYKAKPDLFTEPEKLRLHTILLKVDPSANKATWDAAREEAERIVARIKAGASFEEIAKLQSNDASAERGGDMGYVHTGMIPDYIQAKISSAPLGTLTPPVDVLEGVAVFRLDQRIPSRLREFADIKQRARDLLVREKLDTAWKNFLEALRAAAKISLTEESKAVAQPSPTQPKSPDQR